MGVGLNYDSAQDLRLLATWSREEEKDDSVEILMFLERVGERLFRSEKIVETVSWSGPVKDELLHPEQTMEIVSWLKIVKSWMFPPWRIAEAMKWSNIVTRKFRTR